MVNSRVIAFILLPVLVFVTQFASSQIYTPVKWEFSSKVVDDNTIDLLFTAKIDKGWHVYSQFLGTDDGPIATTFEFEKSSDYNREGKVGEEEPHEEYDPNFDMVLKYFSDEATWTQRITRKSMSAFQVKGYLDFMVCDESKCLPPEMVDFEFAVPAADGTIDKVDDKAEAVEPAAEEEAGVSAEEEDIFGLGNLEEEVDASSQILNPVKWAMSAEKVSDTEYDIIISATIEKEWHLYTLDLPEGGALPTEISFEVPGGHELVGKTSESESITKFEPTFDMDLSFFEDKATFTQRVKVGEGDPGIVKGEILYMVCDASKCINGDPVPFEVNLSTLKGTNLLEADVAEAGGEEEDGEYLLTSVDLANPLNACGIEAEKQNQGLWTIFILGFLGGLVALVTPCVFPMIPLTVSFFTKGNQDRRKGFMRASTYGFFIFLIYVLLSIPFHLMDSINPEILNEISTNVTLNVVFFVIFIVFAISFFGYFELTLPSRFANKIDSASNVGGLIGIFFMALTLAIVSFSCTGPILGSLLAGSLSSDGGAWQLTVGMGGFGLALALPFALFAMFPNLLSAMPRSGGWLTTVKVVLGFVEIALAVKFLSNADLVAHWGILKIELFLGLWIITGIGLMLYLLGVIRFPHDTPLKKVTLPRAGFVALILAFTIYLGSGFKYNDSTGTFTSLTMLSGLAPPAGYSWVYPSKCPLSLDCYKDYDEGLAAAKASGKPLFIDFTGWACVNCRKMEENVWVKPEIYKRLSEEYVVVSLYVDDKQELPEEQQSVYVTKQGQKKRIRTVGNKWATLQTETFANNSQPYYALLSPDEVLLTTPVGYTPDSEEYRNFLDCGLDAMRTMNQTASLEDK